MNKWDEILRWCRNHEKYVRLAVIAMVVITALVFFGAKGEKEEIPVIQNGESVLKDERENFSGETLNSDDSEKQDPAIQEGDVVTKLVVDIDGCVKTPGVYEIDEGMRLYEVIELAGGLTASADTTLINQAEVLYDGQKITIPALQEEDMSGEDGQASMTAGMTADGRININIADDMMLQEIPGVGPATAEKIIAYRESNGKFKSIEEIKNVDGIGEKTFAKIKDMITI